MHLRDDPLGQSMMVTGIAAGLVGGLAATIFVTKPFHALLATPLFWGIMYAISGILLRALKSVVISRYGRTERGRDIWFRYFVPAEMWCAIAVGLAAQILLGRIYVVDTRGWLIFTGIQIEAITLTYASVRLTQDDTTFNRGGAV